MTLCQAIMFRWITHEAQHHTSSCSNVAPRLAGSCPRRLSVIICIGTKNRCNSKLHSQHMHLRLLTTVSCWMQVKQRMPLIVT